GLMAARDRIATILRERTAYKIPLKADDESLQAELDKIDKKLKAYEPKETIKLEAGVDRASLERALAQVKKRLRDIHHPPIEVEVDERSLKEAQRGLEEALRNEPI